MGLNCANTTCMILNEWCVVLYFVGIISTNGLFLCLRTSILNHVRCIIHSIQRKDVFFWEYFAFSNRKTTFSSFEIPRIREIDLRNLVKVPHNIGISNTFSSYKMPYFCAVFIQFKQNFECEKNVNTRAPSIAERLLFAKSRCVHLFL